MTFGEKLKNARTKAGYTQEELANILAVSRAAVAKWESDRGMPDIGNLKVIAGTLGISLDYLLDDGSRLDLSVVKKPIDLAADGKKHSRVKLVEIKEGIVRREYPDAEILRLTVTGFRNTRSERTADTLIGFLALILGGIPLFGTQKFGKFLGSLAEQYYLVNENDDQRFVLLTDEQMISRTLAVKITEKKFEIGDKRFQVVGKVE